MKRRKFFGMLVGALACVSLGLATSMPVMASNSDYMNTTDRHIWEVQDDHDGKVWVRFPFKEIRKGMLYRIEGLDETTTHAQSNAPYGEYKKMGKLRTKVEFLRLPTPYEMETWEIRVVRKVYEQGGKGSKKALIGAGLPHVIGHAK